MSKNSIFKIHPVQKWRTVIDYEKAKKIHEKILSKKGSVPTYEELSVAFGTDVDRTKRVCAVLKLQMHVVRGSNLSAIEFAEAYEKMCANGCVPSHAKVAKELGFSLSAAQQRVDRYKRDQLKKQIEAENKDKKEYEVYAGPNTMRMLVEQVNCRRAHI